MRPREFPERLAQLGTSAQSSVPGIYAWAVTVAPTVCSGSEPLVARWVGLCAPTILVAGAALEPRVGMRARILSLWSFVIACGFVWGAAPAELAPPRLDPVRGVGGMFGWALFALAWAHGPVTREAAPKLPAAVADGESPPWGARVDGACLLAGALAAAAIQLGGWQVPGAESALLVRFATVAAGLAVLGVAANLAVRQIGGVGFRGSQRRRWAFFAVVVLTAIAVLALVRFCWRG